MSQPGARRGILIGGLVLIGIPLLSAWGWTLDRWSTGSAVSKAYVEGEKALAAGDAVKAVIAFGHARGLRPSDPKLEKAQWRAHTLFLAENADRVTLENLEESTYQVQQLVEDEPKNATYLVAMAHLLARRGLTADADKKMSEAVAAEPSSVVAHLARAAFLQQTSTKLEEVINEYNGALKTDPNNFAAHFGLARMYLVKKDPAREIEEYRKAITIDPSSYAAHEGLGDAYLHKGIEGMPDALHEYTKAAALSPGNPDPHWGLGVIMSQAQKWDLAEAELKQAMKGKHYPEIEFQLGLAISRQKRCQEAMPVFLQFVRESPNHAAALFELASCAETLNQRDNAMSFYKKVLDMPVPAADDPRRADVDRRNDVARAKLAALATAGPRPALLAAGRTR